LIISKTIRQTQDYQFWRASRVSTKPHFTSHKADIELDAKQFEAL